MQRAEYDQMRVLGSDLWWFVGMRLVTGALLNRHATGARRILDVGCGTGINLLWMSRELRPSLLVGSDFSPFAIEWSRDTITSSSTPTPPVLSFGDLRRLPFASDRFDLVTNLDVLDQFPPGEDYALGFSEFHRVLRPGGIALVRGPAYRWLMSSHDKIYETKHRHTTTSLAAGMASAGFEIIETTYANTILFPVAVAQRLMRKIAGIQKDRTDAQPLPAALQWMNGPLAACLGIEARVLKRGWRLPFGLSAVCIGRKRP